ncbi:GumC domain-containing protein [Roseivivax sp. CAU 1761]
MLTHYSDLVRQFWKLIAAAALGTGVLACVVSLVLLQAKPLYRSSVTLNMQPSEEALWFNRAFLGVSQFNPATIITQAHIERLLSRPVAARAVDILTEDGVLDDALEAPNLVERLQAALWQGWTLLNYGYHEPVAERDRMIDDLMDATALDVVADSYILKVEVSYDDPVLAARAANALSRAYLDVAKEEFADEADAVNVAFAELQAEKEAELASIKERRRELDRALGFETVEDGRAILLAARTEARQALAAGERQAAALRDPAGGNGIAASAGGGATLSEAEALIDRHRTALAEAEDGLLSLDRAEIQLAELDQNVAEIESDLAELQSRRIAIELAREARLNQVRVIDAAEAPVYPAFPKVFVNTVIGTLLGALLAMVPIAMLDVLGDRVRTGEDLRDAAGARALPSVSRRLAAQAARFRRSGRGPARRLERFAAAMARRFLTEGRSRWTERPVYVTAFGTSGDVGRLHAVIEAAVQAVVPRGGATAAAPEIVALPEMSRLTDLSAYRDGTVVIGVAAGQANRAEVESMRRANEDAEAPYFLTVLT